MSFFLAQIPGVSATPPPEIRDIAPPVDFFPYPLWMVLAAGLAALMLLASLAWAARRWWPQPLPPPPVNPRVVALRELEALRFAVQSMPPYAFSIAVSDVLRGYIEAAFGLHAVRQTSPEFLDSIARSVRFSVADRQLLAGFLERCDLLKFARVEADAEESQRLLESALAFVRGGLG